MNTRKRACQGKVRFSDENSAYGAARRLWKANKAQLKVYKCQFCKGWHLATSRYHRMEFLFAEIARSRAVTDPPKGSSQKRKKMNFGQAIEALKQGLRVARSGWNGKGMWLAYSPGSKALPAERFWAGPNREFAAANGGTADVLPCITMKTATGEILMGWLASQTDMLANDWEVVS